VSKVGCLKTSQEQAECVHPQTIFAAGSESHIEHFFRKRKPHAHSAVEFRYTWYVRHYQKASGSQSFGRSPVFLHAEFFSLVAEISKPEFCTCELFGTRSNAQKGSAIAPDRYDRRSLPCWCLVDREDSSAVLRKRLAFSLRARPRRYSAASAFCAVKRLLRNMIKLRSIFPNYIRLCFLAYAYYVRRWWRALFS